MAPLFRLIQPSAIGRGMKVHYESPDGRRLLCSQVSVLKVMDGESMRVWFRTKREVTCSACAKALEMIVREELGGLSGDQLEDIRAHIATFRMRGNGGPG